MVLSIINVALLPYHGFYCDLTSFCVTRYSFESEYLGIKFSVPEGFTPNVIVMTERLALSNMTVEQYCNALKTQLSAIDNISYEFEDITAIEIAGQTYQKLTAKGQTGGSNIIQDYIFRKVNNRMIGFITTYTADTVGELDTLMNCFVKY